ncbi:MAG: nicotinate-nicotinamide nucleotide adenylyltransferase [Deltaproteobacteria bacterium]|nr:nicotinate-nicotinamide nucleotide adenylyltransferase [Deltaproteobacteria bacterium]
MTRVALFGGSFNPPHVAHQLVALYVLETQPVDELWFVPTYAHPFGKALAPYDDRVAMCELAAAALGGRVKVSRVEEELAGRPGFVASRTHDLIDHLLVEHLAAQALELRLVVGTDILGETAKWHRWNDVVAKAPLIVIGRGGHALPAGSVETGVTMPQIASTRIRELVAQTPDDPELAGLLPREVLWYIARHDLYAASPASPRPNP